MLLCLGPWIGVDTPYDPTIGRCIPRRAKCLILVSRSTNSVDGVYTSKTREFHCPSRHASSDVSRPRDDNTCENKVDCKHVEEPWEKFYFFASNHINSRYARTGLKNESPFDLLTVYLGSWVLQRSSCFFGKCHGTLWFFTLLKSRNPESKSSRSPSTNILNQVCLHFRCYLMLHHG